MDKRAALPCVGIVIDPAEPEKIIPVITESRVSLKAILTTHHHHDHAGGNDRMKSIYKDVPVYGADPRVQAISNVISKDEKVQIEGLSFAVRFVATPCHTRGSVCFYVKDKDTGHLFTGDTLFLCGCGRFFEGAATDMFSSLKKISSLPPGTLVYPGHEYTKKNVQFALEQIEPDNVDLKVQVQVVCAFIHRTGATAIVMAVLCREVFFASCNATPS